VPHAATRAASSISSQHVVWQVGQLYGCLGEQVADCFAGRGSMLGEVASAR